MTYRKLKGYLVHQGIEPAFIHEPGFIKLCVDVDDEALDDKERQALYDRAYEVFGPYGEFCVMLSRCLTTQCCTRKLIHCKHLAERPNHGWRAFTHWEGSETFMIDMKYK